MLHETRDLLVRQRTMPINGLRARLAAFVIVDAKGPGGVRAATVALHESRDRLPEPARAALHAIADQPRRLDHEIRGLERRIIAWHTSSDVGRRLAPIPGIGPITASAIAAAVPHGAPFRSGRQFAAWLGLTPGAHGSGGRDRRTGIGKQGEGRPRLLLSSAPRRP